MSNNVSVVSNKPQYDDNSRELIQSEKMNRSILRKYEENIIDTFIVHMKYSFHSFHIHS